MNDIETIVAREKIRTQLYIYCKAIDTCDWPLLKTCFAEEHLHQHSTFKGSVDEFISFARNAMSKVKTSQHSISNLIVTVSEDGNYANSEAYFNAIHFIEAASLSEMHFYKDNGNDESCKDTDWFVAGIYKDKWIFRGGRWLIVHRNASHSWERVEPSRY